MYRCLTAALAACLLVGSATAQSLRAFPANALRGALTIDAPPEVTLNGDPARLAPGARIRSQNNLVTVPAGIVGQKMLVHYTLDPQGLLLQVWILTADEAAKSPWPTTPAEAQSWAFDPVAQVWTKP